MRTANTRHASSHGPFHTYEVPTKSLTVLNPEAEILPRDAGMALPGRVGVSPLGHRASGKRRRSIQSGLRELRAAGCMMLVVSYSIPTSVVITIIVITVIMIIISTMICMLRLGV